MIFPPKKGQPYKIGYTHGAKTFYGVRHTGVDLIVPTGTELLACFSGKVTVVSRGAQAGRFMDYENDRWKFRYCHLQQTFVTVGANVAEGQVIAKSDNTGLTTGPHLHWPVYDKLIRQWVDPLKIQFSQPDLPLHTRINEAFRAIFERNPNVKENDYYLSRVGHDITTYEKLIDVMKFYKSQGKTMP